MVTLEYLDDERTKLWKEVESLKESLPNAIESLKRADKEGLAAISQKIDELKAELAAVKDIANAKTPEDVATAHRAAEEAVSAKGNIVAIATEIAQIKAKLPDVNKTSKVIQGRDTATEASAQKIEEFRQKSEAAANAASSFLADLNQKKATIDQSLTASSTAANTATANAQEVTNLKTRAGEEYSEIEAARAKIEELKNTLNNLSEQYKKQIKETADSFAKVHSEYLEKYGTFLGEEQARVAKLEEEINSLLPGATSVSLAMAFDERKKAVQKNKGWWAALLIASALFIAGFGWWSLATTTTSQPITAIPIRLVIIAAFIILEEFARRNYNISTRLAEAYAYKEAIAKSYLGFKKELQDIDAAGRDDKSGGNSLSILARTFLDKLEDEPGKRVFDKERPAITLAQALSRISSTSRDESSGVDAAKVSDALALVFSRASWPLVAMVFIVAIAGCFITYLIVK